MGKPHPPTITAFASQTCLNIPEHRRQTLQETFTNLVQRTGAARLTPVTFTSFAGEEPCRGAVLEMYGNKTDQPAMVSHSDQLLADIARRGDDVCLIIAYCQVRA